MTELARGLAMVRVSVAVQRVRKSSGARLRSVRSWLGLLALACGLAAAVGCGVKAGPRPPEDTRPRPPSALQASVSPTGAIELKWKRPTHSADGRELYDLAGFILERRSGNGRFDSIATVPVDDTERVRPQPSFTLTDPSPPAGPLFYRVRAFASDGQQSPPSAVVRAGP